MLWLNQHLGLKIIKEISSFEKRLCTNLCIPFTRDALCLVWCCIGHLVLEMKSFQYVTIISRLKKHDFLFDQTWIPFIQECFVPNFVEIGPVVLEKISLFWYYPLLAKVWSFFWINLNPLDAKVLWDKFDWNWSSEYLSSIGVCLFI